MNIVDFANFIVSTFRQFWQFLFTPLFEGISLGSLILVFMLASLMISLIFRRGA